MLKLMGARSTVIASLILQQALLLGALGYLVAWQVGNQLFPKFPRLVLITGRDLWTLAGIVAGISVAASLVGVWKAMSVEPNTVLS
jgi:putative ABC transport system permease protein